MVRVLYTILFTTILFTTMMAVNALAVEKIVDKVLYPHDPAKQGVYRWSEGSTISLDGKQHLMMLVTALGFGGHDDTAGDILRVDSYDGGLTWTPQDKITVFQKNIGKSNIQSPSLLRLNERELLCFFIVTDKSRIDAGTWMKRSTDNGKTWSDPKRLPYEGYGGLSSDRAYLTSKGRIILPSWVSMDGLKSTFAYCHYSDDRGKTWKKTALLATPKDSTGRKTNPAAEEPTVVELKDGRLMMFLRTYLKSLFVSYSSDNGTTWSKPVCSGIPAAGAMPTLRRMPNGDLLLIWNWAPEEKIIGPWPRNRISSAVSTDDGKTWSSLRHLDGGEDFAGKITMANVAFCNGNAVVTYSKSETGKNAYSWRLQVMPIKWFYEGDKSVAYGEAYRPTLEAKIAGKTADKQKQLQSTAGKPKRLVNKVLFPHDKSKNGIYRWSEGSIINLDGKRHLMMVVTGYGNGGHDFSTPARLLEFHSYDGGLSWTPLADAKLFQEKENIAKVSVRDASLIKLDDGSILAFFTVINASKTDAGPWMKRSTDGGATWSLPKKLPFEGFAIMPGDCAVQIGGGRVLLPVWRLMKGAKSSSSFCFYSDDRGMTWKRSNEITAPKGSSGGRVDPAAEEPRIVELNDGRLKMFLRTYLGSFYVSYSDDKGVTWSDPIDSGITAPGSMPTIKRMPTGDLLLIYNWGAPEKIVGPWPRSHIKSAVSTDDGKTWTSLRLLDGGDDFKGKMTMANVSFCNGNAVITYSSSPTKKNTYDWRLQVVPIKWFYEGDKSVSYGKTYQQKSVRSVGRTHQLFIDDELIASSKGIERIVNQPNKYHANPVLTWDKPWEGNCVLTWGSIIYEPDEKLFKIWYEVYKKFPSKGEAGVMMCYATSRDGIKWDKPNLGLHEFRGSKENNIFMKRKVDAPTVFRDPHPTDDMKYRMYWYESNEQGVMSAISADGINWKIQEGIRVKAGDRMSAGYDPLRKKYYIITRIPGKRIRTCGLWESTDGLKFTFVKEIAAADGKDLKKTELYGMITFPYQGLQIGFLEPFYIPIRKLDTQLMYSRDGVDWHRAADRQTFLPWGPPGSWDQAWVTPSHNPPIRIGERLYIFYQGRQTLHWAEKPFGHIGSVGLAFLRPDGFVSMETQWNEGTVTTTPLRLEGNKLHVNAVARPGTVCAEVLDLNGNLIKGFTRHDALPMQMVDSLDYVLAWKDNATLDKLAGKNVRLRFYVRGAKLFSFWSE